MKSKIIFIFLIFCIASCSNKMVLPGNYDIQLVPEKQIPTKLDNIKVTYIVPRNIKNEGDIEGLYLSSSEWGAETKREKIISSFGNGNMQVESRVDNGIAGSGLIYSIKVESRAENDSTVVALTPYHVKPYQDGLILPFPVPKFDLEKYLSSASVFYKFEFVSEFIPSSIKANFDRFLGSYGPDYKLQTNDFSSHLNVKIYPYRNGSKVIVNSKIFNMKKSQGVINVSDYITTLSAEIKKIVND